MAIVRVLLAMASFAASLVLCEGIKYLTNCCRTNEVTRLEFPNDKECNKDIQVLYGYAGTVPDAWDICRAKDCYMKKLGLLGEDNTIKKEEMNKHFIAKAAPEGKSVVEAALDKCFGKIDKFKMWDTCRTGMQPLMGCFNKEVTTHCPEKMWHNKDPQCNGAREKIDKSFV